MSEKTYVTNTMIPCSPHCTKGEHDMVACFRCREKYNHRALICTEGEFACPPCSRRLAWEAKDRDAKRDGPLMVMLALFLLVAVCGGVCGKLFSPPEPATSSSPEVK